MKDKKRTIMYVLASAFIFSTMEIALKITGSGGSLDEFQLTFIRFLIGGLFLLPFAVKEIRTRELKLGKHDYIYLFLLGFICICLSMVVFQMGVMASNASTAAVIFCINPMFTVFFAHFLTSEKLTRVKVVSMGISLIGLVCIINPAHINPGNTLIGMLMVFIAALLFGLYSAMGKRRIERIGGLAQTSLSFLFGAAALLICMIVLRRPVLFEIGTHNILNILYLSIVVTGLGYLFYFKAMEISNAGTAAVVFFLKPVFAPILAVIVLSEKLPLAAIIGIGFILAGSFINLGYKRKKQTPIAEETDHDSEQCAGKFS